MKIVTGYEGIADATLAIIRGEADGYMASPPAVRGSLQSGDLRPILTILDQRLPDFPQVPTIFETVKDAEAVEMAKTIMTIQSLHRTFFGPPEMDPKMVEEMRKVIGETLADPELIAQAAKMGFPLSFADGATMQERVAAVIAASQTLKPVLKAALASIK
jgi:tripartite-type tricarboxylate transporter receptor subunit TctC